LTILNPIDAFELKRRLDAGDVVLIDIREHNEHAREHIADARLAPLSTFDPAGLEADRSAVAVFHCKSGMRTQTNARRLAACGFAEAYFLAGGIEAWKAAGFPVRTR
jgi:rhodanese-related sulfurtransferase